MNDTIRFATQLGTPAWIALALVPPAIIALYFLKLRRKPVQVPSTLLWRRSVEDLHVNALFQRLRRNLLLFLQLLAVGLALLALAGPRLRGSGPAGQRSILLIDRSASMSARDAGPNASTSRLDQAKAEARQVINAMQPGDLTMIVAFADRASVVSNYTGNRGVLLQRLDSITPSESTTALRDALTVAAGLANPSTDLYARNLPQGVVATRAMIPPKLLIYTDGGFDDVSDFSVGNLAPEVIVVGPPPPPFDPVAADAESDAGPSEKNATPPAARSNPSNNLGILALQTARNDEHPDRFQVFGRAVNHRDDPVTTRARLFRHDLRNPAAQPLFIDAIELAIPPGGEKAFQFELEEAGPMALEVQLESRDALPLDDRAFAVHGARRRPQVLLVTPGNKYLADTLKTPAMAALADVATLTPDQAATPDARREVDSGRFDLVIYDRATPQAPPAANALYFGAFPPGAPYAAPRPVETPVILDWNLAHPLLQYIRDLNLVRIAKAQVVDLPPGATSLIESDGGTLAFTAPRDGGFTDTVLTFPLLDGDRINSDWAVRSYSFPMFVYNAVTQLGGAREAAGAEVHRPGQSVVLDVESAVRRVELTDPARSLSTLARDAQGRLVTPPADRTGLYTFRPIEPPAPPSDIRAFAVNLFDPRESDIATRGLVPAGTPAARADAYRIKIGYTEVASARRNVRSIQDWWKPIALAALLTVLVEWYVYNRRVYV
jgi:hypothetical protein